MDINWHILFNELFLIGLAMGVVVLDIFTDRRKNSGNLLANVGLAGLVLLFFKMICCPSVQGTTLHGSFVQDGISQFFKVLFVLSAIFVLQMIKAYQSQLKRGMSEFVVLVLLSLIGLFFLSSANDFILFFISLETFTVSMYIMVSYLVDHQKSIEAGLKYLILGALSTALFLFGFSFIYGSSLSTNFGAIQEKIVALNGVPLAFNFGAILVLSSLLFKIAAFPFHAWAPDVYEGAPTPVTAYLSMASKAAGFVALIRFMVTFMEPILSQLSMVFAILAVFTILYGNLGAIPQTNIKRLLGYSSIGHSGYLLIGLATFAASGKFAILYYLMGYMVSAACGFLAIICVCRLTRTEEIHELAGLAVRSPLLATAVLISLLSLAGIPPLVGFFAKFYILFSSVEAGLLWLTVFGSLNVIVSMYYYLKVVKAMYLDTATNTQPISLTFFEKSFQYVSIAAVLVLGIYQAPLAQWTQVIFQNIK